MWSAVGLVGAVVVASTVVLALSLAARAPSTPLVTPAATTTGAPSTVVTQPPTTQQAAVFPTVLRIPRIGVTTELVRLGLDRAGALAAPDVFERAGWFEAGPVPGDRGPAVLAGHVDSRAGPAVFFRLKELRAGDEVLVDRSDGTTAVFSVASVRTFPKDRFPTAEVYGPTPGSELRLVTCGGPFDRAGGRYLDNVIVHAVPAGL